MGSGHWSDYNRITNVPSLNFDPQDNNIEALYYDNIDDDDTDDDGGGDDEDADDDGENQDG